MIRAACRFTCFLFLVHICVCAQDMKCNAGIAKSLRDSMVAASESLIRKYYQTFDTSCIRDPEYTEWSNPVLFELMEKRTEAAIKVLSGANAFTQWLVLRELENPINKNVNLDLIAKKISELKEQTRMTKRVLVSLKKSTRFHVMDTIEEE